MVFYKANRIKFFKIFYAVIEILQIKWEILVSVSSDSWKQKVGSVLTLKAPITTAADDIHKYFFIVFQRK